MPMPPPPPSRRAGKADRPTRSGRAPSTHPMNRPRIIVVHDDLDIREALQDEQPMKLDAILGAVARGCW